MIPSRDFALLLAWLDRASLHCVKGNFGYSSLPTGGQEVVDALALIAKRDVMGLIREVNKLSLLLSRAGEIEKAITLLELTTTICRRRFDYDRDPIWLQAGLQPLINKLRLGAMRGETECVPDMLVGLYTSCVQNRLAKFVFGEERVEMQVPTSSVMSRSEQDIVRNACLADSIRSCLITQSHCQLRAVLNQWISYKHEDPFFQRLEAEGMIHYRLLSKEYWDAVKAVGQMWANIKSDRVPEPTALCYLLWTYSALEKWECAERTARTLVNYAVQLVAHNEVSSAKRLYYRLAIFYAYHDRRQDAVNCATCSRDLAVIQDDVVVGRRSAMMLLALNGLGGDSKGTDYVSCYRNTGYALDTLLEDILLSSGHESRPKVEHVIAPHSHLALRSIDIDGLLALAPGTALSAIHPQLESAYHQVSVRVSEMGERNGVAA
jgi:hypothetical protein